MDRILNCDIFNEPTLFFFLTSIMSAPPREKCWQRECKSAAPLRCSRCQHVYYCSRECQRKDYPNHKQSCNILQNAPFSPCYFEYYLRQNPEVARLILECNLVAHQSGLVVLFGLVWDDHNKLRAFISPRDLEEQEQKDMWKRFLPTCGSGDLVFVAARSPTLPTLIAPVALPIVTYPFLATEQVEILETTKLYFTRAEYDKGCMPFWLDVSEQIIGKNKIRSLHLTPVQVEQYNTTFRPADSSERLTK